MAILAITLGVFLRRDGAPRARAALVVGLVAVVGAGFLPLRLAGIRGDYLPEFAWRWTKSPEQLLTATEATLGTEVVPAVWTADAAEWPRFRGAGGDSRVSGVGEALDFVKAAPSEAWRSGIGPGWSAFSYVSGRLFTQEQRGDDECTSCYDADTGKLIWRQATPCRFSDVVAGAGPRATPTYFEGRVYSFGAKAVLACFDAADGHVVWRRDLMQEVGAMLPVWGCSCSPLVTHGRVIVYAGGKDDHGLVAYDAQTGEPAWRVASSGMNFSSPQPAVLADRELILFNDPSGVLAIEPATGEVAWRYKPHDWAGMVICQSQQIDPTSLLVPLGDGIGVCRLNVTLQDGKWNVDEAWSSKQLKPSFNDFVYHDGFIYGFDQHIFVCLDAKSGERRWKKGRYGFGQTLLLADVDQLLVLAESGELVLVAADPREHRELGRLAPLKGKTWNHPTLVGRRIFVRNGEEAVCLNVPGRKL